VLFCCHERNDLELIIETASNATMLSSVFYCSMERLNAVEIHTRAKQAREKESLAVAKITIF